MIIQMMIIQSIQIKLLFPFFFFANCETTAAEKFLATAGGSPPHYALHLRYFERFSLRYDHVITENVRLCLPFERCYFSCLLV